MVLELADLKVHHSVFLIKYKHNKLTYIGFDDEIESRLISS